LSLKQSAVNIRAQRARLRSLAGSLTWLALQGPSLKSFPIVVCRSTAGVAGKKSALQIADFRQHRGAQAARQGQMARVSFFRFLSCTLKGIKTSKKGTSKSKVLAAYYLCPGPEDQVLNTKINYLLISVAFSSTFSAASSAAAAASSVISAALSPMSSAVSSVADAASSVISAALSPMSSAVS